MAAPSLNVAIGRGGEIECVEVAARSFVVRVGDDGIHELVVRGGDAVEVDGHVVVGLERAIGVGAELSSDGEKGIVADVAEAGCFGAAVVMDLGPVVHKDQFVSVSAVGGARAGGAAGSAAGDAGMTKAEAPVHGDEPLSFRVGEREAVAAHDVGGRAGQPKGAGTSGPVAFVDVADALDFVIGGMSGGHWAVSGRDQSVFRS